MPNAEYLWGACVAVLRNELPDGAGKTWLEAARPLALEDRRLILALPSAVAKERIESRYLRFVEDILSELAGEPHQIVLEVHTELARAAGDDELAVAAVAAGGSGHFAPVASVGGSAGGGGGLGGTGTSSGGGSGMTGPPTPPSPPSGTTVTRGGGVRHSQSTSDDFGALGEIALNPNYTFDDFVIGESNRFAAAAALAVAEQPAVSYNPLFIYGDAGLGKTHLLHAIGHYVRANYPGMCVRYVSTEHFLNDFIEAIRTNSQGAFKLRYRRCDVLLVDDVQLIENKATTQEEFFHTFDYLHSAGRQIVISSDRPPKAMATLEDRLRSRFGWGLITDVQPPHLETRLAILRKKAAGEPSKAPDDVLTYIATHITNNIRELEGALNRVLAFSNLNRVPLTLDMAEDVLGDLITAKAPRQITAKLVIEATADMFGLTVDELCGKSRSRPLVTARQVAMYVLREMTDFSYPAIGRAFGDRDHTTVMHAVSKITDLMRERRAIYEQVTELMHRIRNTGS
ncbi:MAG: chromosomal replication initiator protein [Actinomycetota bacterium]|nr:chromosomal replication initiator protein [Actinomycetota bacterium]